MIVAAMRLRCGDGCNTDLCLPIDTALWRTILLRLHKLSTSLLGRDDPALQTGIDMPEALCDGAGRDHVDAGGTRKDSGSAQERLADLKAITKKLQIYCEAENYVYLCMCQANVFI